MQDNENHAAMANAIRFLSMDAVEKANSGHPGLPMGAADIATVLFAQAMNFDAAKPRTGPTATASCCRPAMARCCSIRCSTSPAIPTSRSTRSRTSASSAPSTAGHPEYGHAAGIETTTGPLGQGLANAVGMAIAERHLNAQFGDDLVDHHTYVLAGDGCLMEGISQEAISLAGHLKLNKLIVFWDDNSISIDGPIGMSDSTDQIARFKASGWNTISIDGHDPAAHRRCLRGGAQVRPADADRRQDHHRLRRAHQGGHRKVHGSPLGADEIEGAREKLGWAHAPFVVPAPVLQGLARRRQARRGQAQGLGKAPRCRRCRHARRVQAPHRRRAAGRAFGAAILAFKKKLAADKPKVATRKSSEMGSKSSTASCRKRWAARPT